MIKDSLLQRPELEIVGQEVGELHIDANTAHPAYNSKVTAGGEVSEVIL